VDTVIGFVGRLHKQKGVDLLIRAFALLLRRSADYLLVVAGDGPQRGYLRALARQFGVSERVKFLGVCRNVPEVMATFDVGAVPSRHEPFGRVALELMRMKVPVVCSGVNGLAELITNCVTGLITQQNVPEEIAVNIQNLAKDKELQEKLSDTAYTFSEQFNVRNHIRKLQKIYSQVLSRGE
jgi:glycosyltransferase involved in cell wall biosynthesis